MFLSKDVVSVPVSVTVFAFTLFVSNDVVSIPVNDDEVELAVVQYSNLCDRKIPSKQ